MNKTEFLDALRHALGKLPSYEVEQSIAFYAEMIDDRIEDGMSEQEAVAALGSVHAIAAQIVLFLQRTIKGSDMTASTAPAAGFFN